MNAAIVAAAAAGAAGTEEGNVKTFRIAVLLACACGAAQAQESSVDVSVGLKAWDTQWTTWGYDNNGTVITQVPAKDKVVLIPQLSVRYRDFVGSLSGLPPTTFRLNDGAENRRKEFDANVGWLFTPGVAATVGYKRVGQAADGNNYELAGPTLGLSATAPIRNGFSLYGNFGYGWLKSTSGSNVKFDADYQLSEVGFAFATGTGAIPRAVTVTLGYRIQVLNSKEALPGQDARDLTQGFTLGVLAVF
jgi:hypothetical protein